MFAFAAGPFAELKTTVSDAAVRAALAAGSARARKRRRCFACTAREALSAAYFAQPFPFAKYDLVLLPEFAYGGMEHAGATFLREDSVLFPFAAQRTPTGCAARS